MLSRCRTASDQKRMRGKSAPGRLENTPHVVRRAGEVRCIDEIRHGLLTRRCREPPPPIPRRLPDRLPPPPVRMQAPLLERELGFSDDPTEELQIWHDGSRTPSPELTIQMPTRLTPGAPSVTPDPPVATYNPWDPEVMDSRPADGAIQRGAQLSQTSLKAE